jgi:hypothetical protein
MLLQAGPDLRGQFTKFTTWSHGQGPLQNRIVAQAAKEQQVRVGGKRAPAPLSASLRSGRTLRTIT